MLPGSSIPHVPRLVGVAILLESGRFGNENRVGYLGHLGRTLHWKQTRFPKSMLVRNDTGTYTYFLARYSLRLFLAAAVWRSFLLVPGCDFVFRLVVEAVLFRLLHPHLQLGPQGRRPRDFLLVDRNCPVFLSRLGGIRKVAVIGEHNIFNRITIILAQAFIYRKVLHLLAFL